MPYISGRLYFRTEGVSFFGGKKATVKDKVRRKET
jgi:hypothetical protein